MGGKKMNPGERWFRERQAQFEREMELRLAARKSPLGSPERAKFTASTKRCCGGGSS